MPKRKGGLERMSVLVTVDELHREQVGALAGTLAAKGMHVTEVFALGGVIAGQVAASGLAELRAVEGIAAVEEEPRFTAA